MRIQRPAIVKGLIVLFVFGTTMCLLAAFTLLFPQSPLDRVWRLNPGGHDAFIRMGAWSYLLLGVIATACLAAAIGLWKARRWGYRLALSLLIGNLAGDAVNVLFGHDYRALIGIPIAATLIWLLTRPRTRACFPPPA